MRIETIQHLFNFPMYLTLVAISSACQAKELGNLDEIVEVKSISLNKGEKVSSVGDFNRDGQIDLVVGEEEADRLVVFLNHGEDGLKRFMSFPAGSRPTSIQRLDFNQDGKDDVVIANHETESITLLQGQGDGRFQNAVQSEIEIETKPHSHMIDVADFNSDGYPDIVVDSRDRFGAFILLGQEDGSFHANGEGVDVGGSPYLGFAVSDLNNDGKPDLVTPNNQSHIGVLLNTSDSRLSFSKKAPIQLPSVFSVVTGDINGDGNIDIVGASESMEHGVTLFSGDGQGNFAKLESFPMASGAKMLAIGDINGDGLQDAVVTTWNSDAVLITGTSKTPSITKLQTTGLNNPWSVIFADFDGNGLEEVVIGDATGTNVTIYSWAVSD